MRHDFPRFTLARTEKTLWKIWDTSSRSVVRVAPSPKATRSGRRGRGVVSNRGNMSLDGIPRHTRTVGQSELVERLVHVAYTDLQRLCTNLPGQPELDRKRELMRYLHNLRQRLTRLHVLVEWAPKNRAAQIAVKCGDMMGQLRQHDAAFADAADRLYGLRQQMDWAAGPLYDTPGALDVLCNGKYSNLPRAIADVAPKPVPSETDPELIRVRDERCRRFDVEIRGLLVDERERGTMPKAMRVFSVRNGECVVGVPGEYRATLTLGGPPPLPPPPEKEEKEEGGGEKEEGGGDDDGADPPPPPKLGGWLVVSIEMLAGEMIDADEDEGRAAHARVFPLTKTEVKILGERATARMAGMSPPPPAPPELVEGGAQGLAGLHYVCHDIALRLCAMTVMNQSKKVARGGGAWHGGAIRTEQIMGKAEAKRAESEEKDDGEKESGETTRRRVRGAGEGIRMWFWLPGLSGEVKASGSRMAGVDVGSVEVGLGNAAAVDAAVAAGTLPRVELTYVRADDKDSSSGAIAARALVPTATSSDPGGGVETFELPFSTASVDIKEVLADGIRAAAATRLRQVLEELGPACDAAGVEGVLVEDAVNPGDADEDGWATAKRPAIRLRLTDAGTSVQVTCGKRGGELRVCGVASIASSGSAASVEHAACVGGIPALRGLLPTLRRYAEERDLRDAALAAGVCTHPAPRSMKGWANSVAPAALAIVPPASGGVYVGVFVTRDGEPSGAAKSPGKSAKKSAKKKGTAAAGGGNAAAAGGVARLALVHAPRAHPALAPSVASVAPLAPDGSALLDAKKRKSGEDGSFPFDSFDAVVDAIGAAVKSQRVVAQRATVTSWLSSRGLRFTDARMASDGSSIVAFSAKLGDGPWGAEPAAACEVLLRGVDGVRLTVRGLPRAPSVRGTRGEGGAARAEWDDGASGASRGGVASIAVEDDGVVVAVDYPDGDFSPGAACGDAHRVVALHAFVGRLRPELGVGAWLEPLSAVVEMSGGGAARVSWVGGIDDGGLAAVAINEESAKGEDAASEAARVGDAEAFVEAFNGASR